MNHMLTQTPHVQPPKLLHYHLNHLNHHRLYLFFLTITQLITTMSQPVVPHMPMHGDCGSPQFDPEKPCELRHFFKDLKFHFMLGQGLLPCWHLSLSVHILHNTSASLSPSAIPTLPM